jgi:hypothetical protein
VDDEHAQEEPLTPLAEGYVSLHIMLESLMKAGWTEDQAIKYVVIWSIEIGERMPGIDLGNPDGP